MPFSTIFMALFYPYTDERTVQNLILSVRSLRFALFVEERHRSQKRRAIERFQRAMCPAPIKTTSINSYFSGPSGFQGTETSGSKGDLYCSMLTSLVPG